VDTVFVPIITYPKIIIVRGITIMTTDPIPNIVQIADENYTGCLQDVTGAGRPFVMIASPQRSMVASTKVNKILVHEPGNLPLKTSGKK